MDVGLIRSLAKIKGVNSLKKLESLLDFGNGTIKKWEKQSPSIERVYKVANFLNVSLDYLFTDKESSPSELSDDERKLLEYFKELPPQEQGRLVGRVELLAEYYSNKISQQNNPVVEDEESVNIETKVIPIFDLPVSAGNGIILNSNYANVFKIKDNRYTHKANFAVKVKGDSMYPTFTEGDILLIENSPIVEIGEIGIFRLNGEGYVKKMRQGYIESINNDFDDIETTEHDEFEAVGKVIGILDSDDIVDYVDRAELAEV